MCYGVKQLSNFEMAYNGVNSLLLSLPGARHWDSYLESLNNDDRENAIKKYSALQTEKETLYEITKRVDRILCWCSNEEILKLGLMLGQWFKTVDGKDIYIVDYENLLIPPYDEETAKKITEAAQETSKWLRQFIKDNNIKIIMGDENTNS